MSGVEGNAPNQLQHTVFSLDPRHSTLFPLTAFVIAAGILHAAGIAIDFVRRWPVGHLALWAAGAMVSIALLLETRSTKSETNSKFE